MNVEKFILAIKNRPLMYVEQIRIDYIFYLLKGYVGSNLSIEEKKEIDYTFHSKFYQWVLAWTNKNTDKVFETSESYYWHKILSEVSDSEQSAVNLFFELCDTFFEEYHRERHDNNI